MTPLIVGIAGGTASGKSTLAQEVATALGSDCLHILHDRYYRTMPAEFQAAPTTFNFDHPDALDTARLVLDLQQLKAGHTTDLPDYDYKTHSRKGTDETVAPCPIILVEGILVLADQDLRDLFDHTAYVHAPDDIRLIRRIKRDNISRGRTPLETIDQYERTVRPMHEQFVAPSRVHAQVVIDGTEPTSLGIAAIMTLIGR